MKKMEEREFFLEEPEGGVDGFNELNPDVLYKDFGEDAVLKEKISSINESLFQDLDTLDDENDGRYLDYVKKNYFVDVSKYPVLSHNEIQDLFVKYQELGMDNPEGMAIRDKIIYSNLRLAYKIAKNIYNGCRTSYKTPNISLNDIVQAGNIGLIKAVDSYSIGERIKFISYARRCIKGNIYNYLKYDSAFFTEEYSRFIKPMRSFVDKFFAENGREPTDVEVEQYILRNPKKFGKYAYMDIWYYYKFYVSHGLIPLEEVVDANKKLDLEDAKYQGSSVFLVDDDEISPYEDNYQLLLKDVLKSPENNIDREMDINDFKLF